MAIRVTNEDNMAMMARYEDNHFDLAIVDPEYGIGASRPSVKPNKCKQKNGTVLNVSHADYKHKDWDDKPADSSYFKELIRVSKNQIIWGANYYGLGLNGGRIVWDKLNDSADQYDCEIAYQSFNNRTDIIRYMWRGMFQGAEVSKNYYKANIQIGNKSKNEKRIHPTQKPVKLYEWILRAFAKEGDKIIDTHYGSGSIGLACHNGGFDLTACEIDEEYYLKAMKRLERHQAQGTLF